MPQSGENDLVMFAILGARVMKTAIMNSSTTIETDHLPSGIYFQKIFEDNKIINSGKLIAR